MNAIREILSVVIFVAALCLVVNLVTAGFSWLILCCSVLCFLSAYFLWPSKKKGARNDDNRFLDLLELIIELPIEAFIWLYRLLRLLGRLLSGKGDGIDFDS